MSHISIQEFEGIAGERVPFMGQLGVKVEQLGEGFTSTYSIPPGRA